MAKAKVALTLEADLLRRVDELVREGRFPNRSQAVERAVADALARLDRRRLAEECAKLIPPDEQALAEEGLGQDGPAWPTY